MAVMNKKELFLKKFDQIKDLPTLPAIVLKVNQMLDSPDTNMEILSHVIEKDQAIAFKMLRLVNSAFFGLRDKISSIREAAIILGFDAIRNIVISLSTYNTLNSIAESRSHTDFKVDGFWRHSISVAVLSRFLSEKKQLGDPEKSFVSGLLHDMGKMILAYYFPESFKKILVLSQKKRIIYRKAEERILPGGHHEIGYYIAKKWDIPIHIANTLYSHHNLEIGATTYEDCLIVNKICNKIQNKG
mgnify:CR=1 FL=1